MQFSKAGVTKIALISLFFGSWQPAINKLCMRKLTKGFSDSHKIHCFHVAMIKGIIYTNLAIFIIPFIIAI